MKLLAAFASLALALVFSASASAAEKPLFAASDQVRLVIQGPLKKLVGNREFEGSVAGTLTEPSGQTLPVTLALRGITRRTFDVCDFPPLRVEFATPPPATSLFAGQKKLKLVTHCRNAPAFQQYVLLEYAAYQMYNLLTPRSFRARLAQVDYRDSDGRPMVARVGFFLEDLKDVAERNGTRQVHGPDRIPLSDLSPPDAARYALFQHMLGNHDWSMRAGPAGKDCCHNAELIGALAPGQTIPVPYDFDFSGLVGAPYATPPAELNISDVRQRLYRGYCAHNADALAAARQMRAEQPQILAVLTQVPGLDSRTQARAASYLGQFFSDIGTDASLGSRVLDGCVR